MIDRRELLIGGLCLGALGTGEALRPRRRLKLLDGSLSDAIPRRFGTWSSSDTGDIVTPKTPGSLASKLYSQSVARLYRHASANNEVMLLIAYGESQDDLLQLHRPESCYPAIGFQIAGRTLTSLPLGNAVSVPAVQLTATASGRTEDIFYWTRLGETLPRTSGEQRSDRLAQAMSGYIGDGALVRASWLRQGTSADFEGLRAFLASLVRAMPSDKRKALIGTERAAAVHA